MEYEEFQEKLRREVAKRLGEGYHLSVKTINKNNGISSAGISIAKGKTAITPVIYVENFYLKHLKGESVSRLAEELVDVYHSTSARRKVFENVNIEYEACESRIVYRLISQKKNEAMMEEIPYIPFLDLLIVFSIAYETDNNILESIRIDHSLVERWGISVQQLFHKAKENTPLIFPPKVESLDDIIFELMEDEEQDSVRSVSPFVILTNEKGIHGASALLYDDTLSEIAEKLEQDLYILPSSIHEVLVLPVSDSYHKDRLSDMVCEVNESKVAEEEILSDNVYIYRRKENRIEM